MRIIKAIYICVVLFSINFLVVSVSSAKEQAGEYFDLAVSKSNAFEKTYIGIGFDLDKRTASLSADENARMLVPSDCQFLPENSSGDQNQEDQLNCRKCADDEFSNSNIQVTSSPAAISVDGNIK